MDLHEKLAHIPEGVVTRFAPSPTGYLHLGHVLNMLYVWGIARAKNGRVISRMEDHDQGRFRPEYERAILDMMEWLGFIQDEGVRSSDAGIPTLYRQQDCAGFYEKTLAKLETQGLVFGCSCTRRQLQALHSEGHPELHYPGTCRSAGLPLDGETVRFKVSDAKIYFDDVNLGPQQQVPKEQCGDFSLRDRHGNWTYQFCVVCDDLRQGVNMVIRGQDLFESTGRQILLAQTLGGKPPLYFHHDLLRDESGKKLSKRQRATSIDQLRSEGICAEEIIGRASVSGGLIPAYRPLSTAEAIALFQSN